eukprot:scaffold23974_cov52-Attheya_sp.AAC.3
MMLCLFFVETRPRAVDGLERDHITGLTCAVTLFMRSPIPHNPEILRSSKRVENKIGIRHARAMEVVCSHYK